MHEEMKQRARDIIERLSKLDSSKRPGGGVHGQVIGMEPYIIRTTGEGLQCLWEAQNLIDELVDPFERRTPVSGEVADDKRLFSQFANSENCAQTFEAWFKAEVASGRLYDADEAVVLYGWQARGQQAGGAEVADKVDALIAAAEDHFECYSGEDDDGNWFNGDVNFTKLRADVRSVIKGD